MSWIECFRHPFRPCTQSHNWKCPLVIIWTVVIVVVVLLLGKAAWGADCPSPSLTGDQTYLWKLYYESEDPERPGYRKVHQTLVVTSSGGKNVSIFSMPTSDGMVGAEWFLGGTLISTCGITYEVLDLFSDGFETGTTERWSRTIGG